MTDRRSALAPFYVLAMALSLNFLAACGEDDGEGGNPDIFFGFSGFLIVVVGLFLLWRWSKNRR